MYKITSGRLFMAELIFNMLLHNTFSTKFTSFEMVSELEECLLDFDDSCEEIFNYNEFSKLSTAGRHKNISVIYVKHNLLQQTSGRELSTWMQQKSFYSNHHVIFSKFVQLVDSLTPHNFLKKVTI